MRRTCAARRWARRGWRQAGVVAGHDADLALMRALDGRA
jgi:hypothetical protein